MQRDYERLSIETFGRQLIVSGDLDPVYIALHAMEMEPDQLARWLVVYWCCYHAGVASYLSEWEDHGAFWKELKVAAWNNIAAPTGAKDRWPRAPERRHWRGGVAVDCVDYLMQRWKSPLDMLDYITFENEELEGVPLSCRDVRERVEEHVAFGPWISFKAADMIDRVWGTPVVFSAADVMYDSPEQAAVRLWLAKQGLPANAEPKNKRGAVVSVFDHLLAEFSDLTAPPQHDRSIGLAECETVLCKWGSHMNGHYPLDNDLIEIRAGTEPWASVSKTAGEFLQWFPLAGQVKDETAAGVAA